MAFLHVQILSWPFLVQVFIRGKKKNPAIIDCFFLVVWIAAFSHFVSISGFGDFGFVPPQARLRLDRSPSVQAHRGHRGPRGLCHWDTAADCQGRCPGHPQLHRWARQGEAFSSKEQLRLSLGFGSHPKRCFQSGGFRSCLRGVAEPWAPSWKHLGINLQAGKKWEIPLI